MTTPHALAAALEALAGELAPRHPFAVVDRLRDVATLIRAICPPDPPEDNEQ